LLSEEEEKEYRKGKIKGREHPNTGLEANPE